jgi:glucose/arabinose dehydrogenase
VVRTIADGLSYLAGIAIAPNGTIYATEMGGDIVRMRPDAVHPGGYLEPEFLYREQLITPTGIAIGPDGLLYVSDNSFFPGSPSVSGGRVVRMPA